MRYQDSQLLQRLAAEYVLGTLQGRARRRFERLMADSHHARAAVWNWEQRLSPLAQASGSVQPSAQVWDKVLQRTGQSSVRATGERIPRETGGVEPARPRWYERLDWWRGFSLAATAAALVLAIMLTINVTTGPSDVAAPQYVAVVNSAQAQPLWLVRADPRRGRLAVRSINATSPGAANSYELWILPAGGAAPRSLGLLPIGSGLTEAPLPESLAAVFGTAQGLAVSLEPAGGSPTGAPTGPVLYQAALLTI